MENYLNLSHIVNRLGKKISFNIPLWEHNEKRE